ncbi:hypothetical protein B0T16DRAFT_57522 [Cercophora newfieldiana]|uniref:Uncharacterized protein n=1 Tax=Cercophora newfieldiana TaxID=92897 RepID=A0AA39YRH5_9PEZI|nr:hypothetical protein B0T16DRAFT_57522 [Cercophora newfieldiana]
MTALGRKRLGIRGRHGSRDDWLGLLRNSRKHGPRHEAAKRVVLQTTIYHPIATLTRHASIPLEENAPIGKFRRPSIHHPFGRIYFTSPRDDMGVPDHRSEGRAAAHTVHVQFRGSAHEDAVQRRIAVVCIAPGPKPESPALRLRQAHSVQRMPVQSAFKPNRLYGLRTAVGHRDALAAMLQAGTTRILYNSSTPPSEPPKMSFWGASRTLEEAKGAICHFSHPVRLAEDVSR